MFKRQAYAADYFTGANVTLSLGPCILSQAFGIQYFIEQTKRPIFGYNSQYYDAVLKGQVQVGGLLRLNFISPRYLTVTIHRFYQVMYAWLQALRTGNPETLAEYLQDTPEAANLFSAMSQRLDIPLRNIPTSTPGEFSVNIDEPFNYEAGVADGTDDRFYLSPEETFNNTSARSPDFGVLLEDFFNSDGAVDGLSRIIWGDNARYITDSSDLRAPQLSPASSLNDQWGISDIASTQRSPLEMDSSYARADQFGHPLDGPSGIDITVTFGSPYEEQVTNHAFNYQHSTSVIIKGVSFTGQANTVFANGEPIMEDYRFLARSVHALSRRSPLRDLR